MLLRRIFELVPLLSMLCKYFRVPPLTAESYLIILVLKFGRRLPSFMSTRISISRLSFRCDIRKWVEAHDSTRVSLRSTTCKKLRAWSQHRTTYFLILGSASSMQSLWVPVPLFDGVRLLHSGFTQNHEYFSLLTTPCPYYQLWYLETTEGSSSSLTFDKCM